MWQSITRRGKINNQLTRKPIKRCKQSLKPLKFEKKIGKSQNLSSTYQTEQTT